LNFAPIVLAVPEDVMVNNVNLAIELGKFELLYSELSSRCWGGQMIRRLKVGS